MPLTGVNINNVSMDYFLRGVDAAKPQGVQSSQVPQESANAQIDQCQQAVGKMVSQLDVLLMKAAMASTKGLDGKQVKHSLQTLVDQGLLDKDSFKLLVKTADTAAKTLKALDKFTGRELAAAIGADNQYDLKTAAGKAVAAAVKAQQDLSALLGQVGKIVNAVVRNEEQVRSANAKYKGISEDLINGVNEFTMICDRRTMEIDQLAWQMKNFSIYLAANGENSDPNIMAILKAKVNDLMPRQALAMHGTADALATVNESVSAKLRPIAEMIDAFRNNPSSTLGEADFNALKSDIATMKAALQDIRKNGVQVGDGRMVVARDIIKALEEEVAKAESLFETARSDVSRRILDNYIETTISLLYENEAYENMHGNGTTHQMAFACRDEFILAMRAVAEAAVDGKKSVDDVQKLVHNLGVRAKQLETAAQRVGNALGSSAERLNVIIGRMKSIKPIVIGFDKIVDEIRCSKRLFSASEAMGVFKGTISVSSLIEARARGLRDSDVDPANEDSNIVSQRLLGAGAAGTVYELTRADGRQVVFKGETESRAGLSGIVAGAAKNYSAQQMTANLNIASKNAAKALDMGGILVDYSVGTHNGVFGFYMEKAKGMTPEAMKGFGLSRSSSGGGMSVKEIKNLPAEQKKQVKADLRRELNRMQWLDLVTGQADRHHSNYFVHVDPTTHAVTVKGIDNDAGYSQYRTGAMKFSFDKDRSEDFKALLTGIAKQIDSRNYKSVLEDLLKDPGITTDGKGRYAVDASKIENRAIASALCNVTGLQPLALPDKIDRETYDALMALKSAPKRDAYLNSIRPRLSEASFNAAVSRLDDVITRAEKLGGEGRVIEKEGWLDEPVETLRTGDISVKKQNGAVKKLGGRIANDANEFLCTSIFVRDGLDKIFS